MNVVQSAVPPLPPELLEKFRAIVGEKYAVTDAADIQPYTTEERNLFHGRSPLVLRPGSTTEVAAICKLASEHRIALVPQGGNTGLVGGQTPHNGEVVVSLRRLDKIRDIDVESNTMTCEAGVVLQIAQQKAADVDRLFPLSLGAEGSCTIGGNLSTNAGGTGALAYGVAREMAPGAPEIADELALTAVELGFLPRRGDALANWAARVPLASVRGMVNILAQTERYGTPLAQSLRILATEFRSARMMAAEAKAARLPAVLTIPMIIFVLPPLFIVLIGPAIIQVMGQ